MDKGKIIGGTIMLVVAVLLGLLYLILPEGDVTFMVDGNNLPLLPSAILGVIGIIMLATAGKKREEKEIIVDENKAALNKQLETIAWGVFLIMLGGFAFIPKALVPGGAWSICVGVLLLGLNIVRYLRGIKMSGFTTFLGLVSIISGILQIAGLHNVEGAILLIVLGSYLLIKPSIEKKGLFGKAEEK